MTVDGTATEIEPGGSYTGAIVLTVALGGPAWVPPPPETSIMSQATRRARSGGRISSGAGPEQSASDR